MTSNRKGGVAADALVCTMCEVLMRRMMMMMMLMVAVSRGAD